MKEHKITIGTISKGFREETYLLKDDVNKLINKYILTDTQGHPLPQCKILWEIKEKINGEKEQLRHSRKAQ